MRDSITPNELLAKDRLMGRPSSKPLPTRQDPKSPRGYPSDPKDIPQKGQGMDPKAGDIDYTA